MAGDSPVPARLLRPPHVEAGMAVGLFGGSFNPAHAGHALAAETALRRLRLHQLWWMVTPGNPLKDHGELAGLTARARASLRMVRDRRIRVTAFEAARNSSCTAETLRFVTRRCPGVRFVWVMGADNLADFHRWRDWRSIAATVPIAVIDRPGAAMSSLSSTMAKAFGNARAPERAAPRLAWMRPPAWVFLRGRRSSASSSAIRVTAQGNRSAPS